MGIFGPNLDEIQYPNDDFSIIYTAFQALENLNTFKKYILNLQIKDDNCPMIKLLKEIYSVTNGIRSEELIRYSKLIHYIINEKYEIVENRPGKIIEQILKVLKEELNKDNKLDIPINNTWKKALKEYIIKEYSTKNSNKVGYLFDFFLENRNFISVNNFVQNIIYSYSDKSIFEINLDEVYNRLFLSCQLKINNGIPTINLYECIDQTLWLSIKQNEKKVLHHSAAYLIFVLNWQRQNNYYGGIFLYPSTLDPSYIKEKVESNYNNIQYSLVSIIKEKLNFNGNNYIASSDDDFGKFVTINISDGTYYKKNIKIRGEFNKAGYYEHVLIYKQLRN